MLCMFMSYCIAKATSYAHRIATMIHMHAILNAQIRHKSENLSSHLNCFYTYLY